MKELVEYVARFLVRNPDAVSVTEVPVLIVDGAAAALDDIVTLLQGGTLTSEKA